MTLTPALRAVIDQRDDVLALAPDVGAEGLDVRDHYREVGLLADANGLADGAEQADVVGAFVAHVGVVDAAVLCRDTGELDDLFGAGEAARRIVEAGGHADGTLLHGGVDEGLHAIDLLGRGLGVGHAHDLAAHGSLPDEEDGVGADALLVPLGQRGSGGGGAVAVVAGGDGGDTLSEIGIVAAAFGIGEIACGMGVGIDEAGRNDEAGGVDLALCLFAFAGADEDDAVAGDADVALIAGEPEPSTTEPLWRMRSSSCA